MLPAKISSAVICLLICVGAFQPFCSFAGVMYRKDYVIKQDQGRQIWCEPYLVRKNDSLMKLFNEKGRIIDESPEEFLNIFKRLNPHITNLETIRPGQQIYIPCPTCFRQFNSMVKTAYPTFGTKLYFVPSWVPCICPCSFTCL